MRSISAASTQASQVEGPRAPAGLPGEARRRRRRGAESEPGRAQLLRALRQSLWLWDPRWPELVHPLAAAIDTPLPAPPERTHLMLASKAAWVEPVIGPQDQQFAEYPEESIAGWHERLGLVSDEPERVGFPGVGVIWHDLREAASSRWRRMRRRHEAGKRMMWFGALAALLIVPLLWTKYGPWRRVHPLESGALGQRQPRPRPRHHAGSPWSRSMPPAPGAGRGSSRSTAGSSSSAPMRQPSSATRWSAGGSAAARPRSAATCARSMATGRATRRASCSIGAGRRSRR